MQYKALPAGSLFKCVELLVHVHPTTWRRSSVLHAAELRAPTEDALVSRVLILISVLSPAPKAGSLAEINVTGKTGSVLAGLLSLKFECII